MEGAMMDRVCGVQSVTGPIKSDGLGVTLMHEHMFVDWSKAWPDEAVHGGGRSELKMRPVTMDILGLLRVDPYACLDNAKLENEETTVRELELFRFAGGVTIVDPTGRWPGRQPAAQKRVAEALGINVIASTGYYLEHSHPEEVQRLPIDGLKEIMLGEIVDGIEGSEVRAGLIGEIGISRHFTTQEEKVLRAAARAQAIAKVPLMIHMPSTGKFGNRILDIIGEEGGDVGATILCHLNWEVDDFYYQVRLLERGCWTEYDMLGMTFYYPEDGDQAPCDRENVKAISGLLRLGFGDRILMASDVFLKTMLRRYGGNGYDYVLRHFVPRLRAVGVSAEEIDLLLVQNPRRVFEAARQVVE
jgi:phosphotriesterase-related protein